MTTDYDPLALPAESFNCLPHNLPTQPEPEPEPYVRIWLEHPSGKEVAMLLADDYRRVMHERDELRAEVERLKAILRNIAQQALKHTPAGGIRQ